MALCPLVRSSNAETVTAAVAAVRNLSIHRENAVRTYTLYMYVNSKQLAQVLQSFDVYLTTLSAVKGKCLFSLIVMTSRNTCCELFTQGYKKSFCYRFVHIALLV